MRCAVRVKGKGGRPVSDSTIANDVSHLKEFFAWLQRYDYRLDDPTSRIERTRLHRQIVQPIPDPLLAEALASADPHDTAILCLAAFAGLRAQEICDLTWGDIDTIDGFIHVRKGKGGKPRVVPLTAPVRDSLNALPWRSGWVIRQRNGVKKATSNSVTKRAIRLLGGRSHGGHSLHQLRHRWATRAYQETKDLRAVQEGLGHSSLQTTCIYVKPGRDALKLASEAAATLRLG